MAKEKEKNIARILYTDQGKTAKDIAEILGVSEKTISVWVNKFNWKTARSAKVLSKEERLENIYQIIESLASNRLRLSNEIADLLLKKDSGEIISEMRTEISHIDSAVANWNKTLLNLSKENQINQLVIMQVMEIVFRHFDAMFPQLLEKSMAFQEYFLNEILDTYAVK